MPYVFGGGGGGAGANLPIIAFKDSVTYVPAWTSEVIAYVIGAGGSGGAARDSSDWSSGASGGGAGGTAISRLTLTGGVSYTIAIGAGGARKTTDATPQTLAGAAGGNTTLSGSDISTMTGNGGTGGAGVTAGGGSAAGGTGGSASGGNIANFTGGAAGAAGSTYRASGGGGVSLWTTTPISLDSGTAPAPGGSFAYSSPANSQYSNVISPGAQPGARTDLGYVSPFPFEISSSYLEYDGSSYEYGAYSISSGHIGLVPRTTSYSYHGSPFTGGAGDTYGQSSGAHAAAGQFGSGGGGATVVANSNNANSGAGGDGVVFFITQTIS